VKLPRINYKNASQKTISAYRKLGSKYVDNIADLTPEIFYKFEKLLPRKSKVLDVGCTGGRDSKKFIEFGHTVTGIDLVEEFLEIAKKVAPAGEYKIMDVRDANYPNESFDGIWASMILLHLKREEIADVLIKFHKMLRKGGLLFIGVKKGVGEGLVPDKLTENEFRYFTYFSSEELEERLQEAGFSIQFSAEELDNAKRNQTIIRIIAKK
jgi:SAM-dependent methyltransferase